MPSYEPQKIEKKWQKKWLEEKIYEPDLDKAKKPFYSLMMFPYPSAEGLHVGNMYAFTGNDIYGRMKRMQGYDVFEPIGLDGFGIHSENYSLKIGAHPMDQAKVSEERFYKQLHAIGNGFAWDEHLETYDPEYYRWTQWIFVQMFKNGLAYRKKQEVNWCPKDQTVLADEQVEAGRCERCGTEVIKKELEQWFFKITEYAERLLKNLTALDWSERVKIAQKNWIGKSEGLIEKWKVDGMDLTLETFTTWPHTTFGATFLVIAPEHPVIAALVKETDYEAGAKEFIDAVKRKRIEDRESADKEKEGFFTGRYAINPLNGRKVPLYIANFAVMNYGTGIVKCTPTHDERDFEFAKKYDLPMILVVKPKDRALDVATMKEAYRDPGVMTEAAGKFAGLPDDEAREKIAEYSIQNAHARRAVQYRLRDWLISRQRYWGPPIPMIHCDACAALGKGEREEMPGWYAVPEKELPVTLPRIKNFRPTGSGVSPLAAERSFYEVKCPGCGGKARRETDVSDTFLDSAWYYLRYLDVNDDKEALNQKRIGRWLPAGLYTGGAEHSVLHLLYVRFVAMALHDWGLVPFEEPFKKFRAHGLLIKDGAKMSKSKGNVINPDEYIANFGADTLRMYLMFLAPFEQGGDFRDEAVLGIERFLKRVWQLKPDASPSERSSSESTTKSGMMQRTIKKVTEDIERLHYNTAVSSLMVLLRALEEEGATREDLEVFLKLLAPLAPHITEEMWREALGHKSSIHREPWPDYDPALIKEDMITLVLQVNGKVRDTLTARATINEEAAKELALASEKVKAALGGKKPKRIIYVEKKLVNIVLSS